MISYEASVCRPQLNTLLSYKPYTCILNLLMNSESIPLIKYFADLTACKASLPIAMFKLLLSLNTTAHDFKTVVRSHQVSYQ